MMFFCAILGIVLHQPCSDFVNLDSTKKRQIEVNEGERVRSRLGGSRLKRGIDLSKSSQSVSKSRKLSLVGISSVPVVKGNKYAEVSTLTEEKEHAPYSIVTIGDEDKEWVADFEEAPHIFKVYEQKEKEESGEGVIVKKDKDGSWIPMN